MKPASAAEFPIPAPHGDAGDQGRPPAADGPWVGRPMRRREDLELLRGHGTYVANLRMEGMAYLAVLRSPVAHARILSVDATAAKAAPGVIDVLTAADIAEAVDPMPVTTREGATQVPVPVPLLARDKVRFAGEPVAAVVAETRARAEDALELIDVTYQPLPALVEPRQAATSGVVLHDGIDDNVLLRWSRSKGDVADVFRTPGVKTVHGRFHVPRLVAAPLETRGCAAAYDTSADFLTLWCSAQDPHRPLRELETVLRRPADRTRVLVPDVGGAFGSKGTLAPEYAVTALAAIRLRRPVTWTEDRSENFLGSYQGRGLDADAELALAPDGRFLALRAHLMPDLGAYLYPVAAVSPTATGIMLTGPYDIPAASVEVTGIATNKVPTGPYRGAGRPEAAFVIERLADMAARSLGIDPAEIRHRNLIRHDAFPYRNALGYTYDSGDYTTALTRLQELLPYPDWRARQAAGRADGRLIGIGLATFVDRSGPGLWERAKVTIEPAGTVIATIGSSPHGQGHETTFAQIAADALGVTPDTVQVRHGDSAEIAGMGTYGSRSVTVGGSALVNAAEQVKEQAKQAVACTLEVSPRDLVWAAGRWHVAGSPEYGMTLAQTAQTIAAARRLPPGVTRTLEATDRFSLPGPVFPFGAYAAVVEIDPETGTVNPLRIAAVDDAGVLVNPLLAEGQVHGSIIQGLAAALWEEMTYDDAGQPLTTSFADYGIPSAAETAVDIQSEFQATPSPFNPLGAKGIGETGTIGVPAAVANAVADALAPYGIEHVDPPYTPEKIWRLLQAADPREGG
jgi:aerobic carbon-monoxide dehydrogenase large subunit